MSMQWRLAIHGDTMGYFDSRSCSKHMYYKSCVTRLTPQWHISRKALYMFGGSPAAAHTTHTQYTILKTRTQSSIDLHCYRRQQH